MKISKMKHVTKSPSFWRHRWHVENPVQRMLACLLLNFIYCKIERMFSALKHGEENTDARTICEIFYSSETGLTKKTYKNTVRYRNLLIGAILKLSCKQRLSKEADKSVSF